jgi:hypothetical protein
MLINIELGVALIHEQIVYTGNGALQLRCMELYKHIKLAVKSTGLRLMR